MEYLHKVPQYECFPCLLLHSEYRTYYLNVNILGRNSKWHWRERVISCDQVHTRAVGVAVIGAWGTRQNRAISKNTKWLKNSKQEKVQCTMSHSVPPPTHTHAVTHTHKHFDSYVICCCSDPLLDTQEKNVLHMWLSHCWWANVHGQDCYVSVHVFFTTSVTTSETTSQFLWA